MSAARALQALLAGAIDYAGLFPPASLDMRTSVATYAAVSRSDQAWMLGRFVLPAARLAEFTEASAATLPLGANAPWRLCAVAGAGALDELSDVEVFNRQRNSQALSGRAAVEMIEVKVNSAHDVRGLDDAMPRGVRMVCEVVSGVALTATLQAVRAVDGVAKIRTGGVTADAIPSCEAVGDFMLACKACRVPFKATAGLHHPLRGEHPLTYDGDAPRAVMHGFLNVLFAAAIVDAGAPGAEATVRAQVVRVLDERDSAAFTFTDEGARWADVAVSAEALAACRARFGLAFGSCSVDEPIAGLRALHHAV